MKVQIEFDVPEEWIDQGQVGVDEFVTNGLMPLASSMFKTAILDAVTPRTLSDADPIGVVLRVCDWKSIRDELYQDADAEDLGPNEANLVLSTPEVPADVLREAERVKDAELPAHSNGAATSRCADIISKALVDHGWID